MCCFLTTNFTSHSYWGWDGFTCVWKGFICMDGYGWIWMDMEVVRNREINIYIIEDLVLVSSIFGMGGCVGVENALYKWLNRLLLRHRARRTAAAVRAAARSGWQRRWWGLLSVALQQAVASTAQGHLWIHPQQPAGRPATSRHPRFGAFRWPQPPAPAVAFHPNRAVEKRRGREKKMTKLLCKWCTISSMTQ